MYVVIITRPNISQPITTNKNSLVIPFLHPISLYRVVHAFRINDNKTLRFLYIWDRYRYIRDRHLIVDDTGCTEELKKPQPEKSTLRQIWNDIKNVLPNIVTISGAVAQITNLFSH